MANVIDKGPHWGEWRGPPDGQVQLKQPRERKPRVIKPKSSRQEPEPLPSPFLTVHEVAAHLRVHAGTMYRIIKRGDLRALRVGGDWRIDKEELDRWLRDAIHT